jgi:hypothetical protein
MRFARCKCDPDLVVRIPRSLWMRVLFPSRRHYYCSTCQRRMLIAPFARSADTIPQHGAAPIS